MTVRRRPRRPSLLVAVVLAAVVALGATGCSGGLVGPSPAATVGDAEITRAQLSERMDQYQDLVRAYGQAAQEQREANQGTISEEALDAQIAQQLEPYQGTTYTLNPEGAATQLTQLIRDEVMAQALDAAGAEVTDEQRDAARTELASSVGVELEELPQELVDSFVEFDAGQAALEEAVPQELRDAVDEASAAYQQQLREAYDANPDAFARVCGLLLATEDEASAQSAKERIDGGEAFAEVAAEVSVIDPAAAQSPQCYDQATIAGFFSVAELEADAVLGPAEDTGRWVVFEVDSLETASFEEALETLTVEIPDTATAAAEAAVSEYVAGLIADAAEGVVVDPRYGTWDPDLLEVVPNGAAPEPAFEEVGAVDTGTAPAADPAATDPAATDPAAAEPAGS